MAEETDVTENETPPQDVSQSETEGGTAEDTIKEQTADDAPREDDPDTADDADKRLTAIEQHLQEVDGLLDIIRKAVAENTTLGQENVNEAVEEPDNDIADPIEDLFSD
jgi:hypothetical protein